MSSKLPHTSLGLKNVLSKPEYTQIGKVYSLIPSKDLQYMQ